MNRIAYTEIMAKQPDAEGRYWSLGLAEENVPGYSPLKETGTPEDPFYVAKGPTRFATQAAAKAEAIRRNQIELHLNEVEAFEIVASSIGAQMRMSRQERVSAFGRGR